MYCGSLPVAVRDFVDTEKVLREADGSVKLVVVRPHTDGKLFALGCASETDRTVRAGEEPEEHKRSNFPCYKSIVSRSTQKQRSWQIVDTLCCRFGND